MKKCRMHRKVLGVLAALYLSCFPPPIQADQLEIPGTGACEALLREIAAGFNQHYPQHQVVVPPSIGSGGGIGQVMSGKAVLARVARPLKKEEQAAGLRYLAFAHDLVIFAVGSGVPIKSLTTAQLFEVYAGKITDWRELGGPPGSIRLLLREPGDSSLQIIQKHLPPFRDITFPTDAKVVYSDLSLLAALQKYKYSLGWLTLSSLLYAKAPIQALALEGIDPTLENAQSQKYKLIEEYALVF